jgi:hypothetical protein
MPKLRTLRDRLLRGEVELTGWRCTWDTFGSVFQIDKVRRPITALELLDLKFDCLPHDWSIVLIPHNERFSEMVSNPDGPKLYAYDWNSIQGWSELYLSFRNAKPGALTASPIMEPVMRNYEDERKETDEPIYRTGLAGKPTSWHLIEAECRRRWKEGERHSNRLHESRTEWARVLLEWLGRKHPDAPMPKLKTLKNNLATVLRELAANDPHEL